MKLENGPNPQGTDPLEKVFPNLMLPLLSSSSFPNSVFPSLNIPLEMSNIWIFLDFKSRWEWWPTGKLEELAPASSSLCAQRLK